MSAEAENIRLAVAALAMQGVLYNKGPSYGPVHVARVAVEHADALLLELKRTAAP